jgi:apolipoprotein N-acyltransferase
MCISTRLANIDGWRAYGVSYLTGALMVLGFAPFYLWPVIFISLPTFYLLLNSAPSLRHAALRGFFFGYGYFMAGTWWIANSMLVDAAKFAWMMPFSILGLSAVLALYFGLLGALMHRLRHVSTLQNILRFAVLWVVVEYLRSIGLFGFPWNLAGYVALASTEVAQAASIVGTFGLSLLVVLAGTLPVLAMGEQPRMKRLGLLLPTAMVLALYTYGAWRMPESVPLTDTTLRIVQPNIAQVVKHTEEGRREAIGILTALSQGDADVILWPETAYPFTLRGKEMPLLRPPHGLLIAGAVRVEETPKMQVYNSIVALDANSVRATYDKHQLVPFGEFVPLRSVLPIEKITPGGMDFSRGVGARTITLDDVPPFSPLVCYEVVFPWMAVDKTSHPDWMVNATNDGWYGDSPGPYQHFDMTRMRAVEQGLPMVRVANTGISALIDPYGRVLTMLALNQRGAKNAVLPQPLISTTYAKYGELLTLIAINMLWLMSFFAHKLAKE